MSTNGNVWQPSKAEKWTCPSGQEVWTRPPGPAFTLRLGRSPRTFSGGENLPTRKPGQTDEDFAKELVEHVSDEDLVTAARELIVAMMVSPKIVLNPNPELGELGPDDTGMDFWPLYNYGMEKYFGRKAPIEAGDGEVEVSDLESFREEHSVSGDGMDSLHVPVSESEPKTTNQGVVSSAGD